MTSQKRYRHHQENNSSRFRDLPPRFKRQKSSSGPSPPPTAATPDLAVQTSNSVNHTPSIESTDLSPAAVAPSVSPSVRPGEDSHCPQPRARTDIPAPQVLVTNPAAMQWPQNVGGAVVLSPWDSRHINTLQNTLSHVPLGTHFGYEQNSPPLSPWASSRGMLNVTRQQNVAVTPAWATTQNDLYMNQRIHNSPVYFDNENWAPSQNVMPHHRPDAVWGKLPIPQQYNSSSPPPRQSSMSPPTKFSENTKASIDYSDPDIRTIEMLRELERVADEKEIECDDFGVDRKSLVSHHLRMLMCAVDRYTEGIEDDITVARRNDEVATSQSCGATPTAPSSPPHEMWQQKQVDVVAGKTKSESETSLWSPGYQTSLWKNQMDKPVTQSASGQPEVPVYSHKALYSSPQPSPVCRTKEMVSHNTATWDLWSSPCFDFSGVLTSQNPENIFQNLVGRFSEKNEKERKPLYQR